MSSSRRAVAAPLQARSRRRPLAAHLKRWFGKPEETVSLEDLAGRDWAGAREAERLVESSSELRQLLRRTGYSPAAERRWPGLLAELEKAQGEGDSRRSMALLEELEALLGSASTRRREVARREVLAAASGLREEPRPALLGELAAKVDVWLFQAQEPGAAGRRRQLEELLRDLVEARHRCVLHWPPSAPEVAAARAAAREHARRYLDAGWMHTRWLTTYVLVNLLAAELAALAAGGRPLPDGLQSVWSEVATGRYDPRTTLRRLRRLESRGLDIPSLAYPLLRLRPRPAPPAPRPPRWRLAAAGWPGPPEVDHLMESSPVRRLLRGLDYSPAAEKRWRRLQQELRAAVERTEVSDLPSSVAAERLAALLDELAGLLDVARTRRRERARRAVTSALAALRRSPAPGQTLSGPLTELEERVETWLRRAQPEASRGRRRQLEKLLDDLVETRRRYALGWPLSGDAVTAFHAAAREHAGRYLDAAWMHTPELTAYALANLLASELARLMASPVTGESAAVAALRRIWAEVVSGRSDAGELRRRLRRLEAGGLSVDSLILPLLRIRPGAAATAGSLALEPCWELAGDGWPGRRQVARLLDSSDDLHLVLERLGYAPAVERRWPELWRELRGLISVEIPDFPALLGALDEIRGQLDETNTESSAGEAPDGEAADDPLRPARRAKRDDPLLRAVLAAGDDEPRVLAILAEDPVERVLPFIEEIPFIRDGEISWRMPVEIPLLRKRPRDGERFTELLDELDGLLDGPRTKRRQQARHEVTDAIARVKKALDRHDAYLPAPLKALEGKVVEWLYHAHSPVALERRRQLEELLRQLADARHRYGLDWPLEDADIGAFGDAAQEHARLYVEAEWMHAPWLTAYVLANLLASELAPRMTEPSTGSSEPVALLRRVWREAASGRFNRRESLRRLRQLEEGGIYVHSLAVALLRIEG